MLNALVEEIAVYMQNSIESGENVIDLADNLIYDAGVEVVAAAIPCCSTVDTLKMSNCGFTDVGLKTLIASLQEVSCVKFIDCSSNPVTDSIIEEIC